MPALFTSDEILGATISHLKSGPINHDKGRIFWELEDLQEGAWFIAIPSHFQDPHDNLDQAIQKEARGLIAMPKVTQVLIFEAGAVKRGDITRIGGALDPDLAIRTQIHHPMPSPERENSLKSFSNAMESLTGLPLSRAELWFAVEAAKALGLSKTNLEEILELEVDTVSSDSSSAALRQTALLKRTQRRK